MVDLDKRLAGHPTATALLEGDTRLSYAELRDRVLRTAAGLRGRGLTGGARIGVLASPTVDGVVGYLGVQAAGLVPVMLSTRSPRAELERRFETADPALVILGVDAVTELPDVVGVVRPAGSTATDVEVLDGAPGDPATVGPDDAAVVLYTSGVSGLPRPVILTYGNLSATARGLAAAPGSSLDHATIAFAALPMAHVFGLNSIVGSVLAAGGVVVLHDGFEPLEVAELVARHRVTSISAVPLQWKVLATVGRPDLFATVNRATWSAAPMPPAVAESVKESLDLRLAGGYGLTETSGTVCLDDASDPHPGTVGVVLDGNELRVVDGDADALPGDTGEIWLRGPSVVRSYLDGTPCELVEGGWLQTGDVGLLDDDGRLVIVDRIKDVININGFSVSPSEVEQALATHPGVATSVVVGDVDGDHEIVVAHVVAAPGRTVDEAGLVEHCRTRLSRYKVPSRVHLHDELPVTDSGKAVRRLLNPT